MKVMVVFPGHIVSTVDVAWGLCQGLEAAGHEVIPFYYHTRLAYELAAMRYWAAKNEDFEFNVEKAYIMAAEGVAIEAIDTVPDMVLVVNNFTLHWRGHFLLGKLGIPRVLVATESPYMDGLQAQIARDGGVRGVLVNDKNSVIPMREQTDLPVEYLPHSFNPERHRPVEVGAEYQTDCFFWGTWWPERHVLLNSVMARQNGHKFKIDGIMPSKQNYENKANVMDNEEMVKWYSGTKIALSHHRTLKGRDPEGVMHHIAEGGAYSLGPRAYEIAACGAFQLSDNSRPELAEVFGDSVATYRDPVDLPRQVEYYLKHDDERREMAAEALQRVQGCTFQNRVEHIIHPFLEEVLNG